MIPLLFLPEKNHSNNINNQISPRGNNHGHKQAIIITTNTIINPHTMMIKIKNTPKNNPLYTFDKPYNA